MGITLREVTTLFPFSEAKLIAGEAGLDNNVESANIQEVPDVSKWLKGGEIVFSAGYAFHAQNMGVELIEQLSQKGAAALALKPGQYLNVIPQEMIDRANELGFPLFELPESLPYMDCILPIFERLTQKRLVVLERMEAIHDRLTQVMIHNEGIEGICSVLRRTIQQTVALL